MMAKVKIEIEVDQVLTAAVALELDPGDKVLVMNGVIIGMVEKHNVKGAPPPVLHRKAKVISKFDDKATQRIIELLRNNELTAHEIGVYLKRDNNGIRLAVGKIISHLRERKIIEAADDGRFPIYRLAKQQS
jgi:hypothetical protein